MKRILLMVISCLLIGSLPVAVFAGGDSESTGSSASAGPLPTPGEFPIEGDHTLSYWVPLPTVVATHYTNYADTPFYEEVMKRTGVNLEFKHPPADQAQEQLNLMLSSRTYPDIVETNANSLPGGPSKALKDGYMLDITDIVPEWSVSFYKFLQGWPEADKMIKTDAGQYFSYPLIRDPEFQTWAGYMLRKNYLDELGLDGPRTIEEWTKTLRAFRDELDVPAPFAGNLGHVKYFAGGFRTSADFYVTDNQVRFGPIDPEFKDYLSKMKQWYAEKLLDPDFATLDSKQITAKITNGSSGSAWGAASGSLGAWLESMEDVDPAYDLLPVRPPSATPDEQSHYSHQSYPYSGANSAFITDRCKNVEVAAVFLDYGYTQEGHMLYNFGVEGLTYEMVDGFPKYTDFTMHNPDGLTSKEIGNIYFAAAGGGPFNQDIRYYWGNLVARPQHMIAKEAWLDSRVFELRYPPTSMTPEEGNDYASVMTAVNTFVDQSILEFIFGDRDLADFDKYVREVKSIGIDDAIKIKQAALDRYNAR